MNSHVATFTAEVNKEKREFKVLFLGEDLVLYDCIFKKDNGAQSIIKNISCSRKFFSKRTGWNP